MKNIIYYLVELIILTIFDNKFFIKEKAKKPSLLSYNVAWFTECGWVEQMIAFKQKDFIYSK